MNSCMCGHPRSMHALHADGKRLMCIALVPVERYRRPQARPGQGVLADRHGGYNAVGRVGLLSRGELCHCEAYALALEVAA